MNKIGYSILLLSVLMLHAGCQSSQKDPVAKLTYIYLDGTANKYIIKQTSVEYIPVKPEQSSSGMYSGGNPWEVKIDDQQFARLHFVFQKAIFKNGMQKGQREKGTGMLIVEPDNVSYIFKMNSPYKKDIEDAILAVKK